MDFSRPVFWHEGMLLRPQHFQQQDRHQEALLHSITSRTSPCYWGVLDLRINQDSLQNMILEVETCDAVLADGALIRYPDNANLESRSFEDVLPPSGEPLSVYLGVMKIKPGDNNANSPYGDDNGSGKPRRFTVKEGGSTTYDLFASERAGQLDFLRYDVRIFFGAEKESAADFQLLKIAEVQRSDKGFVLSRRFIPASTTVASDMVLLGFMKKARDLMGAKARELLEMKRDQGMRTRELSSRDMLLLFYSLSVNRYVPLLYQITETPVGVHPFNAYALLRGIVGELSSFSSNINYLGAKTEQPEDILPAYEHEDLFTCFNRAVELIELLMDDLIVQSGYSVKLLWDGEFYSAGLDPEVLTGRNRYYLIISTAMPANELLSMMKDTAKICSKEGMPTLITRALFGVPVEHLPSPPPNLPQRAHAHYFVLDHTSNIWKRIEKENNIAISFEKKQLGDISIEFTLTPEDA